MLNSASRTGRSKMNFKGTQLYCPLNKRFPTKKQKEKRGLYDSRVRFPRGPVKTGFTIK